MASSIDCLPNEILIQILSTLRTRALLQYAVLSVRFSSLIRRILHYRLLLATSLPAYRLILEAYNPTHKHSEPYLFCSYLGTPGLGDSIAEEQGKAKLCVGLGGLVDEGNPDDDHGHGEARLYEKLRRLHSRFQPKRTDVERSDRHSLQSSPRNLATADDQPIEHIVTLDSHEMFNQFCIVANLVKVGPRQGVFLSIVNIADKVVRLWRGWLEKEASFSAGEKEVNHPSESGKECDEREGSLEGGGIGIGIDGKPQKKEVRGNTRDIRCTGSNKCPGFFPPPSTIWIDHNQNFGLLFQVREPKWGSRDVTSPILESVDDEHPTTYKVKIKAIADPELLVRTTHLLLAAEESLAQQMSISGKAMVFGSFSPPAR